MMPMAPIIPLIPAGSAVAAQQSPEQLAALLWPLLAEQARQYTGGASSSLPVETVQRLMASLCYTLGLAGVAEPTPARLAGAALPERLRRGRERLARGLRYGEQLWRQCGLQPPGVRNRALTDTLYSIGGVWRRYDPIYFAHELPCEIDYPLSQPVPETLQGVDYLNTYLEQLLTEQRFLRRFAPDVLLRLLLRYCPDPYGQLINLYEPAAANALGRALLALPLPPLDLGAPEQAALQAKLRDCAPAEIAALLEQAAHRAAREFALGPRESACLLTQAHGLAPRVISCRDGRLDGIFLSLGAPLADTARRFV